GANIQVSLHGTQTHPTDPQGEATFTFPAAYKGKTYTVDVFKEGYQSKSTKEQLGKRDDIHLFLNPKDKREPFSTHEQVNVQKLPPDPEMRIEESIIELSPKSHYDKIQLTNQLYKQIWGARVDVIYASS